MENCQIAYKYWLKRDNILFVNKVDEHDTVTKCSNNKGFNCKSGILPRSSFGVGRQESTPQSLTAATPVRYGQG